MAPPKRHALAHLRGNFLVANDRQVCCIANATVTRLSAFDDGPKTGMVFITTVSLFDATGTRSTLSTFRKGRAVDTWTETVAVKSLTDLQHGATYSRTGRAGDKLADIRLSVTRKGDELLGVKEAKESNAPDSSFANRTQTRLKKKPQQQRPRRA